MHLPHKTASDRFASHLAPRRAGVLTWLAGWWGEQLLELQALSGGVVPRATWVDFTN